MAYIIGPHPGPETLEQYALGQLAETDAATVEEHFLICGVCRDRLDQMESFIAAARIVLADAESEQATPAAGSARIGLWSWSGGLLVTASLTLVVIGIVAPWRYAIPAGPAQTVTLVATRGPAGARVFPGPIELKVDATQLPEARDYRFEVVNSAGKQVWRSSRIAKAPQIRAAVPRIGRGQSWVRIYGGDALIREYGLAVE